MKFVLLFASASALTSVMLGAFAAHGLKSKLSTHLLDTFQVGVQYQMYHSLALIMLVILYRQFPQSLLLYSAGFIVAGIIFFSGSLYMLALTQMKWFGPVTPIGGMFFIIGWLLLCVSVFKGGE